MGFGEPKMSTPEEIAENQKQRILSNAELVKGGAEVTPEGKIITTEEQQNDARKEMFDDLYEQNKALKLENEELRQQIESLKGEKEQLNQIRNEIQPEGVEQLMAEN